MSKKSAVASKSKPAASKKSLTARVADERAALLGLGLLAFSVADQADEESNLLAGMLADDLDILNDVIEQKKTIRAAKLSSLLAPLRDDVARVESEGRKLPQTAALAALLRPVLDRLALALELDAEDKAAA